MSLATISIVGNLAKEPELFLFSTGRKKTTLLVAVNSFNKIKQEKRTDYYRVETWDKLADLANTYLHKGNQVAVSGKIALEKWVDREGKDRITPTVQANQLAFPPRNKPANSELSEVNSRDASTGSDLDAVPLEEAGTVEEEVQTAPLPPVEKSYESRSTHDSSPGDSPTKPSMMIDPSPLKGTVVSLPPDDLETTSLEDDGDDDHESDSGDQLDDDDDDDEVEHQKLSA